MPVYLTANPNILERSHYNPLIRLTGQLIRWLPSNIKNTAHCSFFKRHHKKKAVRCASRFSELKNAIRCETANASLCEKFSHFDAFQSSNLVNSGLRIRIT